MKLLALTLPDATGKGQVVISPPAGVPDGSFASGLGKVILANSLNMLFVIAAILVLIYMVWGGVQWVTSGGEKEKIAAARSRIMYAVIGLVIIALAIPIVNIFLLLFGGRQIGG